MQSQVYLQNAAAVMIPSPSWFGISAWLMLKSVPVKANFAQQFDIFRQPPHLEHDLVSHHDLRRLLGLAATFRC